MDRVYVIPIIIFVSIVGLVAGLIFRLITKEVPKNILIYTVFAVLLETIIHPLFFPIFFDRKKHARNKAQKIIDELKSNNLYQKNKISKSQLEKYIYYKLTFSKVYKMWMSALKDMIYNFDKNTNETIDKIKESNLSELISERENLKARIRVNNKKIKKYEMKITYLKSRLVLVKVINSRKNMIKESLMLFKSLNECSDIYRNVGFKVISNINNSYQDKLDSNRYSSNKNEIKKYLNNTKLKI